MRKILLAGYLLLGLCAMAQEPLYDKVFFANSLMPENYFYSETSYEKPSWIKNANGKLCINNKVFFTPGNSLELEYVSAANGKWQAKVLYNSLRGVEFFKPVTHLGFWLLASSETGPGELPAIGIGDKDKRVSAFLPLQNYIKELRLDHWVRISIPIKDFSDTITKAAAINAIVFQQQSGDGKDHHLYIDQLELFTENAGSEVKIIPKLISATGFEKHVDIVWPKVKDTLVKYIKIYRSTDNKSFYPVGIQSPLINRYADFTDTTGRKFYYKISLLDYNYKESALSAAVGAATKTMTDEQLLDMVQQAHFRYYWEGAEGNSGLAHENIPGRRNMIAAGASGFGMMALIAGTARKFITRQQAVERFDHITQFLEKAQKFHGAFPHFIDGPTGKVEPFFGDWDNGGDLVETAFLTQGLLAAKQYFNANNEAEQKIRDRIQKIWEGIEWNWYRRYADSGFLYWHWSPDKEWIVNHKLIGWNETMITYILGISSPTHSIPASMYYSGWASQAKEAQHYRSNWGGTTEGDHYINGNTYFGIPLKIGVSDGGPLFFIHYSYMGLDPHKVKDAYTNYFSNNRNIALINYRYCTENPKKHTGYGPGCWGLTASLGAWDYSPDEPVAARDAGKMTPTGALASFPYTPQESMQALKNYYRNYGKFLWGEYGFRDAFNLDENWCSEIYMGLNQAPVVVMIENYRSGLTWNLFMKTPGIENGLKKIELEKP